MIEVLRRIAEERIKQAIKDGEFDDLKGKGKPLELKEDPFVPEELRLAYKILKNAGFLPPELELRKEIATLEELLENSTEKELKDYHRATKRLNFLIMKLNQMRRCPVILEKEQYYRQKVAERLKK